MDTTTQSHVQLLIEEYKLCQEKAACLENNIWQSAGILGVGSVAGILGVTSQFAVHSSLRPLISLVIGLLAIGLLITWIRFANRWWSIQQATLLRMEHIERRTNLRMNLYVRYLNDRHSERSTDSTAPLRFEQDSVNESVEKPILNDLFVRELDGLNYHHRGIRPMAYFAVIISITAWSALVVLPSAVAMFASYVIVCSIPLGILLITAFIIAVVIAWFEFQ